MKTPLNYENTIESPGFVDGVHACPRCGTIGRAKLGVLRGGAISRGGRHAKKGQCAVGNPPHSEGHLHGQ